MEKFRLKTNSERDVRTGVEEEKVRVFLQDIPEVTVILGTDASGKDHVADILKRMILEAGGKVEKRKRYLNGKVTERSTSVGKSWIELGLELCFLRFFRIFGTILPWALNLRLGRDLDSFVNPEGKLIVIGHNCLRGFAFYWGHQTASNDGIRLSEAILGNLRRIRNVRNTHFLVLDVQDDIRKRRIAAREERGEADYFDRYMANNEKRSERIERCLVWLCRSYLDAQLITNNDLSEKQLRSELKEGFLQRKLRLSNSRTAEEKSGEKSRDTLG